MGEGTLVAAPWGSMKDEEAVQDGHVASELVDGKDRQSGGMGWTLRVTACIYS